MASHRLSTHSRRDGLSPLIQAKSPVSMEEWEAKAPLGELESKSVTAVKSASERTPLPSKFSLDEAESSRPSTPLMIYRNRPPTIASSRPGTPLSSSHVTRSTGPSKHSLHPRQPIQTPQQFYDWFALVDKSVAHSQEAHFRAHIANVSERLKVCDWLTEKFDFVDQEVEEMAEEWSGVEEGGKNLKDACQRLLEERDKLIDLTNEIGGCLQYFQELEHAMRMLNHPGESLVLQSDFLYMVERVDICINYMKAHRHFREAEMFLFRYQQCLTRAMTLIKMYFVGSLRALSADVSKRLSEKDVSPTAQMHLLYTRFQTVSFQLLPLLEELERRARSHPQELSALLAECHTAYLSTRKSLLTSRVTEEISGLDPSRTELVELTRAGCSYIKQLCTDEFDLYHQFFSSGEQQLYQYLEGLCDHLYDDLRPRILHEQRLTALCEVCTVLQALMVLNISPIHADGDDERAEQGDESLPNLEGVGRSQGPKSFHVSHLLQMVLQDAQTRLFFKAQSIIQSDIRYYVPKSVDLAYPDVLLSDKLSFGHDSEEKQSVSELFRLPSINKQETWYPTLRKTVWILSQLHDFVKPAIFEDIAQEAISLCRQSLAAAAEVIRVKTPLDAELFLLRHLLLLKKVVQSLDLAQREPGVNESKAGAGEVAGVTSTLTSMFSKTTSLLPEALFVSLGMPRTGENFRDVKHDIDYELRHSCEAIVAICVTPIAQPLLDSTVTSTSHPDPLLDKSLMPSPPSRENFIAFERACTTELRERVGRLKLYLGDTQAITAHLLLELICQRIGDAYEAFHDAVESGSVGEPWLLGTPIIRGLLTDVCLTTV